MQLSSANFRCCFPFLSGSHGLLLSQRVVRVSTEVSSSLGHRDDQQINSSASSAEYSREARSRQGRTAGENGKRAKPLVECSPPAGIRLQSEKFRPLSFEIGILIYLSDILSQTLIIPQRKSQLWVSL